MAPITTAAAAPGSPADGFAARGTESPTGRTARGPAAGNRDGSEGDGDHQRNEKDCRGFHAGFQCESRGCGTGKLDVLPGLPSY